MKFGSILCCVAVWKLSSALPFVAANVEADGAGHDVYLNADEEDMSYLKEDPWAEFQAAFELKYNVSSLAKPQAGGLRGSANISSSSGAASQSVRRLVETRYQMHPMSVMVKSTKDWANPLCWQINRLSSFTGLDVRFRPCHQYSDMHFYFDSTKEHFRTNAYSSTPGYYTNKCLHYNGVTDNIQMWDCHNYWSNQKWYVDTNSRIRSRYNNKCLGRDAADNNMRLFDCRDSNEQKMIFSGSLLKLKTGECLEAKSNGNLDVTTCNVLEESQRFYYHEIPKLISTNLDGGQVKCIDRDDMTMKVADCANPYVYTQRYWMDNYDRLRPYFDGAKCLTKASSGSGAKLANCDDSSIFTFEVESDFYPTDTFGPIIHGNKCAAVIYKDDAASDGYKHIVFMAASYCWTRPEAWTFRAGPSFTIEVSVPDQPSGHDWPQFEDSDGVGCLDGEKPYKCNEDPYCTNEDKWQPRIVPCNYGYNFLKWRTNPAKNIRLVTEETGGLRWHNGKLQMNEHFNEDYDRFQYPKYWGIKNGGTPNEYKFDCWPYCPDGGIPIF